MSPVTVEVFFFFFPDVSPDNPKGADCVCWSATSPESGGAGPVEPAGPPLTFVLAGFGALARALKRVFTVGAVGSRGLAGWSAFEAVSWFEGDTAPASSVAELVFAAGRVSARRLPEADLLFLAGLLGVCLFLLASLLLAAGGCRLSGRRSRWRCGCVAGRAWFAARRQTWPGSSRTGFVTEGVGAPRGTASSPLWLFS